MLTYNIIEKFPKLLKNILAKICFNQAYCGVNSEKSYFYQGIFFEKESVRFKSEIRFE